MQMASINHTPIGMCVWTGRLACTHSRRSWWLTVSSGCNGISGGWSRSEKICAISRGLVDRHHLPMQAAVGQAGSLRGGGVRRVWTYAWAPGVSRHMYAPTAAARVPSILGSADRRLGEPGLQLAGGGRWKAGVCQDGIVDGAEGWGSGRCKIVSATEARRSLRWAMGSLQRYANAADRNRRGT